MTRRISKQPLEYPSAGSVFVRPTGNYASALIEQCGLKGKQIGGAMVSTKHAGFLVNYDNATYEEFTALIYHVQKEVAEQTGYSLECEIKIIKKE
ncbi:UDP-N-acetylenolpyruvoylglucosamine reductase [bioreactor metagenome]|uniref:UDP-N-acetylenolpyruvoylglucosamine reductase n=2 Tax=root TaxID=1 RepID=A0A645H6F1_9ZZZZ